MKRDGKYRFTLQFPAETEEQISVGNLLEQLGNRKSAIVVEAVNDYILSHPELLDLRRKIQVKVDSNISSVRLEKLIRTIVEEKFAEIGVRESVSNEKAEQISNTLEADVVQMLDNLDLFQ
ncbi:MAG: hypothetical protein IJO56_10585 [Oscillospiraceae bacterium]|nr:hypothetical protein [Oscillospiraceae bacterium]MBQ9839917.1 hypothetical protein [Oscillospiraceae bacterium]